MPTLSISLSGSAIVNGTKTYTVSDADVQSLLNWAAVAFSVPAASGNAAILLAWVQQWISGTIAQVQMFQTPPSVPPPISIA